MRKIKFYEAIKESQTQLMMRDKSIVTMGLGINDPKGIFGTTKDLNKIFGNKRVLETPTSENAITGIAVGAAIEGLRPIITHQRVEFSLLSMEQIINQAAKWYFLSGGKYKVPIVIRLIIGKGWGQGPQHSQSLEALFSHIPGLKVVSPSNAYDAKGLLASSIKDNHPVIFFEHRWLHNIETKVPKKLFTVPIGKAKILQKGKDLTIISFSEALVQVLRIRQILEKSNISAEIIDLRSLRPFDKKTILKSVKKTKKVLVVDNSWKSFGISSEIISFISENILNSLTKKPKRLGIKELPLPSSRSLAKECYLNTNEILDAIASLSGKKINRKVIKEFLLKNKDLKTDIPYKDFKGPF
ncbi:MAG: alpha-ketoacid dehydrogenase subunit beta [Gammaproteobacteria bacterium TMED34]|nr:MAG: alpha-ketoacid dehydrogenase subunit beta [Gammaproteobacteria bacterium TMED34]